MHDLMTKVAGYLTRMRRRRAWKKIVSVMACLVVFCTTYALILPALTLERSATASDASRKENNGTILGNAVGMARTASNAIGKPVWFYQDGKIAVQVILEDWDTVPEDALLVVRPVTRLATDSNADSRSRLATDSGADYEELATDSNAAVYVDENWKAQAEAATGREAKQIEFYDISFYTPDGEYLPVEDTATVTMRFEGDENFADEDDVAVLHYHAEGDEPVVLDGVEKQADEGGATALTFRTEGFSVFAVVNLGKDTSSFRMKYGEDTIVFHVIDSEGNAIPGTYEDIEAKDATRYIFGKKDKSTADTDRVMDEIAPKITGYTYSGTAGVSGKAADGTEQTSDDAVYSVAVTGYEDGFEEEAVTEETGADGETEENGEAETIEETEEAEEETIDGFRFYTSEPLENGASLEWGKGSYEISLIYTEIAADYDGRTFAIVNQAKGSAYALTAETTTVNNVDGLKSQEVTITETEDESYSVSGNVTAWTFHKQEEEDTYTISTVVTGEDGTEETQYLLLAEESPDENGCGSLTLTADEASASLISVTTLDDGVVTMESDNSNVNLDIDAAEFWSYNSTENLYSQQNLYEIEPYALPAAQLQEIDTVNHPGTTINLFDYWITTQDANDVDASASYYPSRGINSGRELVFAYLATRNNGVNAGYDAWNLWTQSAAPYARSVNSDPMVERILTDGYPVLNIGNRDSLDYLFDPEDSNSYKASYTNVGGLLKIDERGYYSYNSAENYAYFDKSSTDAKEFTVYNDTVTMYNGTNNPVDGQFFPFITPATAEGQDVSNGNLNHFFGLTMTTRFVQKYGGHTNAVSGSPETVFNFTGDDDVWIFIDGVLVADLGGIHNAASVSINFSDGTILINNGSNSTGSSSTLRAMYEAAGQERITTWNGNTFADDTYHTMKFFYLERGHAASNMQMTFNLISIPETAIYKVDQYGDPVEGAVFEVYNLEQGRTFVETLKTDREGKITFQDENGGNLSIQDIEKKYGSRFALVETAPPGYGMVSDEVILYIENGLLLCEDKFETGAYSAATLLVTAPTTLISAAGDQIDYYTADGTSEKGTLFAVVLKYTGEDASGVTKQENWIPVYGNDREGYTSVTPASGSGTDFIQAVIDAAKMAEAKGDVCFAFNNNSMQLEMTNLPGDIKTYYHMILQSENGDPDNTRYTVGYYWTKANDLSGANTDNTRRVNAESDTYRFEREFGARVEISNLINRLFVQKLDESGNRINGASFALYSVTEEGGNIYYQATNGARVLLDKDTDADNQGTATVNGQSGYTYSVNSTTGVITIENEAGATNCTISPANNGPVTTSDAGVDTNTSDENGTASFAKISDGYYYLREIQAPLNYEINPTEVMVLVSNEAVYANAGTADDGVSVARGPGYLIKSLNRFASQGIVDNTLTWIQAKMRISEESTSFLDYDADGWKNWNYLKENETGVTTGGVDTGDAFAIHLSYDPDDEAASFNYIVNNGWYLSNRQAPSEHRKIYTPVGWSYYELYQDYDYGVDEAEDVGANYEDLGNQEIAHLFSRSTYVQVTDQKQGGKLEISKDVVNGLADTYEIQVLNDNDEPQAGTYTYQICDEDGNAAEGESTSGTFTIEFDGAWPTIQLNQGQKVKVLDANSQEVKVSLVNISTYSFRVELRGKGNNPLTDEYSYTIYSDTNGTEAVTSGTIQASTVEGTDEVKWPTIELADGQMVRISGLPEGTTYSATEVLPEGNVYYDVEAVRDAGKDPVTTGDTTTGNLKVDGKVVTGTLYWVVDNASGTVDTTSTIAFTNTRLANLELLKVDNTNDATVLSGAKFKLYMTEDGTNKYYTYEEGVGTQWLPNDSGTEPTVLESGEDGKEMIYGVPDGVYYLEEIAAPAGYDLLAKQISVQVTGGKMRLISGRETADIINDDLTLKVSNSTGKELPETGGSGTNSYQYGGLLFLAAAACGYMLKRRREGRAA